MQYSNLARVKTFSISITFLLSLVTSAQQSGSGEQHPLTVPATEYAVTVNNKSVFVYQLPVPAAYCSFDVAGPIEVVIKANRDVKWVDVRPLSSGIKATFKDSVIKIRLTRPQKLSIELNGSFKHPLFLFANSPERNKPRPTTPGVKFFEKGKVHQAGIIRLKSNESVYIEEGAVVVGVIHASNAQHVKVFGRGILDGTGNRNIKDTAFKSYSSSPEHQKVANQESARAIEFSDCSDVTVEGITLHNSTSWQVVPINCDRVLVQDVKIIADQASDDGIDIVRSRKVVVRDCFVRVKDDCVAIKANFGYPKNVIVDDVLVEDCVFWNGIWGNGVEIGFELDAAEIKNIVFRNCDIIRVEAGAAISIHNASTGHVRNVTFDNIRIENTDQKLFDLAIIRSQYSPDGTREEAERRRLYLNGAWDGVLHVPVADKAKHAPYRGKISDIIINNVSIVEGPFPFSIFYGFDEQHSVRNVQINNLQVHGKKITRLADAKIYMEHAYNVQLK